MTIGVGLCDHKTCDQSVNKIKFFESASPKTLYNVYKGVIFIFSQYILTIEGFKSSEFFKREGEGERKRKKRE
jgi:hypothetical protein